MKTRSRHPGVKQGATLFFMSVVTGSSWVDKRVFSFEVRQAQAQTAMRDKQQCIEQIIS